MVLAYGVLAGILLGPSAWAPRTHTVGIPSIDSMDTAMLRALTADAWLSPDGLTRSVFFPNGFDPFSVTPNVLDHLTALPMVVALSWPLADNLWWWCALLTNGLAAHALGWRLTQSHQTGFLAGIAFVTSDAVLREANLHHAPQVMLAWAPLLLAALLVPPQDANRRTALAAGVFLAIGALCYWYSGLFAVLAMAPLLVRQRPRLLMVGGSTVLLICLPFLLPQLLEWDTRPLTAGAVLAPPRDVHESFGVLAEAQQFVAWHGVDPLFWVRDITMDTSSRVPLSLVIAAALGARTWSRRDRRSLGWICALGALMVLGPVLRWDDTVVTIQGHSVPMPFAAFRALHPFFERLTWPERWGWLVPLGLVALACRAPRAGWFAAAVLLENAVVSQNFPLQSDDLRHGTCWTDIPAGDRAIVELPLDRGLRSARSALHGRMHGRPVVNPVLLPPGMRSPEAWDDWTRASSLMQYLGRVERGRTPPDPGAAAIQEAQAAGIGAIALDVEPGHGLRASRQLRVRTILGQHLGPPIDLGCAWIWWLDPDTPPPSGRDAPERWREDAARWKTHHPAPELEVLIQPMWDQLRQPDGRSR